MNQIFSGPQPELGSLGQSMGLTGDALSRGRGQALAEPHMVSVVSGMVMARLESAGDGLISAADYLSAQWKFMDERAPGQMAQIQGIAEGYGIAADDLFAYLHLSLIDKADGDPCAEEDGCSVVACRVADGGPLLAKNRDHWGEHRALQRVFLESDPAWQGRRILSVGSLGSPGAYSSGMNSDGLALADTAIDWRRPGVGWLRYLLMNEILINFSTVVEALDFIKSQPHAGGGSLVLMDVTGRSVSVELTTGRIFSRTASPAGIGQTNHFLNPNHGAGLSQSSGNLDALNSRGRLTRIENWLDDNNFSQPDINHVAALMGSHDFLDATALCCHGDDSETISTSLFACASRRLYFCPGNPCTVDWRLYGFELPG